MRQWVFSLLIYLAIELPAQDTGNNFFESADAFFKNYVVDGRVDYKKIKSDPTPLNNLLHEIDKSAYNLEDSAYQKAFLINAYNIFAISGIVRYYPVSSPKQIGGYFYRLKYALGRDKVTLDQLEKGVIKGKFQDPRIHFALNCAAEGCPELKNFAYHPSVIEKQLDEITIEAINDPLFTRVKHAENRVDLSQIFVWYKKDFLINSKSLIQYVNSYRNTIIPPDYQVGFYPYDWELNEYVPTVTEPSDITHKANVQIFTPSVLLKKGQFEFHNFNNLYTQTAFNLNGRKIELNERQTFYTGLFQITYGVSKSGRFNAGFDMILVSARYDKRDSSPFKILSNDSANFRRTELGSVGPRVKFAPFRKWPNFSMQSTLLIPVARKPENPRFLTFDRISWWNQFFYDYDLGDFQLFFQLDLLYRFRSNNEEATFDENRGFLRHPLTLFVNYFPGTRATLFAMVQHSPVQQKLPDDSDSRYARVRHFTQLGGGAKYQLTDLVGLEFSYTKFVDARNDGLGYTLNLGIRYIY